MAQSPGVNHDAEDDGTVLTPAQDRRFRNILQELQKHNPKTSVILLSGLDPDDPSKTFDSLDAARAHANGLMSNAESLLISSGRPELTDIQRSVMRATRNELRLRAFSIRSAISQAEINNMLVCQTSNQHQLLALAFVKGGTALSVDVNSQPGKRPVVSSYSTTLTSCHSPVAPQASTAVDRVRALRSPSVTTQR